MKNIEKNGFLELVLSKMILEEFLFFLGKKQLKKYFDQNYQKLNSIFKISLRSNYIINLTNYLLNYILSQTFQSIFL